MPISTQSCTHARQTMSSKRICVIAASLFLISSSSSRAQQTIIGAPDGEAEDHFGYAVDANGQTAIIGAYNADGASSDAGAAYMYNRINGQWQFAQKLTAVDGDRDDFYGYAVAISGDVAAVGARGFDIDSDSIANRVEFDAGSVYIYRFNGTSWSFETNIRNPNPLRNDIFGDVVAVDGNVLLIGAHQDDDSFGSVFVYRFDGVEWQHEETFSGRAQNVSGSAGRSVAVQGDVAVFGTTGRSGFGSANAYVYRWDGTTWNREDIVLLESLPSINSFGFDVAINDVRIVVGAPGTSNTVQAAGAVHVLEYDGSDWVEIETLLSPEPAEQESMGATVDIRGDAILAGAPFRGFSEEPFFYGSYYHFASDGSNWTFESRTELDTRTGREELGRAVALGDDYALIGAHGISYGESVRLAGGVLAIDLDTGIAIEQHSQALDFAIRTVYPNPTRDQLNVELANAIFTANIVVYDVLGRAVSRFHDCAASRCSIDVTDLAPGVYMLRATELTGTVATTQFVIAH